MGLTHRWFVDSGTVKGFVPAKILAPFAGGPPPPPASKKQPAPDVTKAVQAAAAPSHHQYKLHPAPPPPLPPRTDLQNHRYDDPLDDQHEDSPPRYRNLDDIAGPAPPCYHNLTDNNPSNRNTLPPKLLLSFPDGNKGKKGLSADEKTKYGNAYVDEFDPFAPTTSQPAHIPTTNRAVSGNSKPTGSI